jgi:hypothetical protein
MESVVARGPRGDGFVNFHGPCTYVRRRGKNKKQKSTPTVPYTCLRLSSAAALHRRRPYIHEVLNFWATTAAACLLLSSAVASRGPRRVAANLAEPSTVAIAVYCPVAPPLLYCMDSNNHLPPGRLPVASHLEVAGTRFQPTPPHNQ